jgi:hypothetical protein
MYPTRRQVLVASLGGAAALLLRSTVSVARDQAPSPVPASPGGRRTDADEPNNPSLPAGASKKAILEQHQKDMKKDIEKLYDLATQLKTEVEKTDATSVLSLEMVKKAEEIEKLARQIKDHAKG